ncbi:heavy metal translocating P-type ATPase [Marinobacterium jannaschii]|uniref:heavy metal translocating P-type ATPase n=1 Tax=Marinobacterium jannaschii TaxID=64970 RepID=UPI0004843D2C|nr:heavy metal translocating P-type ATPase [Marinobacterium jannaschii]
MSQLQVHHYALQGIKCAGCVRSLERALGSAEQISDFSVNFADRTASIQSDSDPAQVISVISAAGYGAEVLENEQDQARVEAAEQAHYQQKKKHSLIALATGALMMLMALLGWMPDITTTAGRWLGAAMGLASLLVMLVSGAEIYRGAWSSARQLRFNMDTLIGLGTGAAWLYSSGLLLVAAISDTVLPQAATHLYYEAAVMILGFILLGQMLETRARGKTAEALRKLVKLQPETALRLKAGEEKEVPVALLQPGDQVRIRPGESVPVDGIVADGHSYLDESMLTGESRPVSKAAGDALVGGTINGSGSLLMTVSEVGHNTVLAKIVETVRQAQNSKPAIGKLADDIAAVFVPAVMVVALITALAWWWLGPEPQLTYAIVTMMTVLIVACPCALGLATPMSVMVAVGRAAATGVLIRNGDALQRAREITTVVLDKTGTVTRGKPAVTAVSYFDEPLPQTTLNGWISALEARSEHPLAAALTEHLGPAAEVRIEDFQAHAGSGLSAIVEGHQLVLGNAGMMNQASVDIAVAEDDALSYSQQACSLVYVALDQQLVALFAVADPLKEDSAAALAELRRRGVKLVLLSGDNQRTAEAVATQVGIDQVIAEVKPEDKLKQIQALQARGEVVAMVGDGVNDAPALAQADVGMAIGSGTDVAIASADITLMSGSLTSVAAAIDISAATVRNIRQNLFGAFIYNTLAIPLAAGILFPAFGLLLNPMIAGAAMAMSSVTVVSNANRLRWQKLH